jgi:hypothetical protein
MSARGSANCAALAARLRFPSLPVRAWPGNAWVEEEAKEDMTIDSFALSVRAALQRLAIKGDHVDTCLWEAPELSGRLAGGAREVSVEDWITEITFHLSDIECWLEDILPGGDWDSDEFPDDLLFHSFSAVGYHLLGLLYETSANRREHVEEDWPSLSVGRERVLESASDLQRSLHAVSSLAGTDESEYPRVLTRWVAQVIVGLAGLVADIVSYRESGWDAIEPSNG